jgi:tyrosyl-tRNA synthetase
MPLLEGTDGVNKMSKSLGNYIGITDATEDMFGKIMSISDELMWRYFELLSFRALTDIAALKEAVDGGQNPRDVKFSLAEEIVDRFHGAGSGPRAREAFVAVHRDKTLPEDLPLTALGGPLGLAQALKSAGLVASNSEAFRLIDQRAVRVDGERVEDRAAMLEAGAEHVLQVGRRRFARVKIVAE